ncbi:MAG: carbonic anhydrase [Methanoregula sp.]|nr:carbonic anhydrase [Methanoregula sp.]
MIEELLKGNVQFSETVFKKNIGQYRDLVTGENPKVLWIGCSDARIQTGHITNAPPGSLYIHRNLGNLAPNHDWNFASILENAVVHLKVEEIVVCGHSDCSAIRALDEDLRDAYIPIWLSDAREAKKRVDSFIAPPRTPDEQQERWKQIEIENVRLQIENLLNFPLVKTAVNNGEIKIYGLYYDLSTGLLSRIV